MVYSSQQLIIFVLVFKILFYFQFSKIICRHEIISRFWKLTSTRYDKKITVILKFFPFLENALKIKLHTYIIGHYNPSVRIIDLVSYTTYVVCVNFRHKWQFKADSERQIFWETFHGSFYLLSEFLPEICWEEIAEEILFVFRFVVWTGTRTLENYRIFSQISFFIWKYNPSG